MSLKLDKLISYLEPVSKNILYKKKMTFIKMYLTQIQREYNMKMATNTQNRTFVKCVQSLEICKVCEKFGDL